MSEKQEKNANVYEIDITKKYILMFSHYVPAAEIVKMQELVKEWIKKDDIPFLFIHGEDVKLVKVEE